jgi:hypothetical protein
MKTQILKPGISAAIGLLFAAPTLYFILISVLKYVFGLPALLDAQPQHWKHGGLKKRLDGILTS